MLLATTCAYAMEQQVPSHIKTITLADDERKDLFLPGISHDEGNNNTAQATLYLNSSTANHVLGVHIPGFGHNGFEPEPLRTPLSYFVDSFVTLRMPYTHATHDFRLGENKHIAVSSLGGTVEAKFIALMLCKILKEDANKNIQHIIVHGFSMGGASTIAFYAGIKTETVKSFLKTHGYNDQIDHLVTALKSGAMILDAPLLHLKHAISQTANTAAGVPAISGDSLGSFVTKILPFTTGRSVSEKNPIDLLDDIKSNFNDLPTLLVFPGFDEVVSAKLQENAYGKLRGTNTYSALKTKCHNL